MFETLVGGHYANPVLVVDEIDKAGSCVAAIERSLGTFQNLDALQVEHRPVEHEGVGVGDFVHIRAHCRGRRNVDRVEADATQRVDRHALIALRDREARRDGAEILHVGDAQGFEIVAGEIAATKAAHVTLAAGGSRYETIARYSLA